MKRISRFATAVVMSGVWVWPLWAWAKVSRRRPTPPARIMCPGDDPGAGPAARSIPQIPEFWDWVICHTW